MFLYAYCRKCMHNVQYKYRNICHFIIRTQNQYGFAVGKYEIVNLWNFVVVVENWIKYKMATSIH